MNAIGWMRMGALAAALGLPATSHADDEACTKVTTATLAVSGAEIAGSKMQDAGSGLRSIAS